MTFSGLSHSLLFLVIWNSSITRCAPLPSLVSSDRMVITRDTGGVQNQHGLTAGLICTLVIIALLSCLSILTVIKYGFIKARRTVFIHSVQSTTHVDPFAADTSYFANSSSSVGTQPAYETSEKRPLVHPFLIGLFGSPEVRINLSSIAHTEKFCPVGVRRKGTNG